MPDFSNPFKPRREKKTTAVLPFSEHVYTDPWQAREQLAREEEEKLRQARVFKAQPIVDAKFEVNVEHKSTTNPQPFELQSEKIAAERKQQFIEKVQKLSEEERKHREFKAQPAKVLESDPFVPARSIKVLTNTTNVELHSEKRAKERKAYDEQLAKAQAEQERLQAELERRAKEEEEKEIKDLRNQLVHKAQPVKKFK